PARPELELLRSLRILGPEQARASRQRRSLGADLGEGAAYAAAAPLADSRDVRIADRRCLSRPAAAAGASSVPALVPEDGTAALLRRCLPVSDDGFAADQDGSPVAVQPQVHRSHPGDLLQHLTVTRRQRTNETARADPAQLQHEEAELD